MNIVENQIRELCVIETLTISGMHFTEWAKHYDALESLGFVEIHRPVNPDTGIAYSQDHWSLAITEDGQFVIDAHPELHAG